MICFTLHHAIRGEVSAKKSVVNSRPEIRLHRKSRLKLDQVGIKLKCKFTFKSTNNLSFQSFSAIMLYLRPHQEYQWNTLKLQPNPGD